MPQRTRAARKLYATLSLLTSLWRLVRASLVADRR